MKRIRVQSRSHLGFVFLIILFISWAVYILIHLQEYLDVNTVPISLGFLWLILLLIRIFYPRKHSSGIYVSEILLKEKFLTLVYHMGKKIKNVDIAYCDIEGIHAKFIANNIKVYKRHAVMCETLVTIRTKTNGEISFHEVSPSTFQGPDYRFILELLKVARELPNFTYELDGNNNLIKEDVKNFAIHGKRLNSFQKYAIEAQKRPVVERVFLACIFLFVAFVMFRIATYYLSVL